MTPSLVAFVVKRDGMLSKGQVCFLIYNNIYSLSYMYSTYYTELFFLNLVITSFFLKRSEYFQYSFPTEFLVNINFTTEQFSVAKF